MHDTDRRLRAHTHGAGLRLTGRTADRAPHASHARRLGRIRPVVAIALALVLVAAAGTTSALAQPSAPRSVAGFAGDGDHPFDPTGEPSGDPLGEGDSDPIDFPIAGTQVALLATESVIDTSVVAEDVPAGPETGSGSKTTGTCNDTNARIRVTWEGDWPSVAKHAFLYACSIWASELRSPVEIWVRATWDEHLPAGELGRGGPVAFYPVAGAAHDARFPSALADRILGYDVGPGLPDIEVRLNRDAPWYTGTDGRPGGAYDLVTASLHHLGHGLGLVGGGRVTGDGITAPYAGTVRKDGYQTAWEYYTYRGEDSEPLTAISDPAVLADALRGGNVRFRSPLVAAPGARLYAPLTWSEQSYVNLDEVAYPRGHEDSLMTPYLAVGEAMHRVGPVTKRMLNDLGWHQISPPTAPSPIPTPVPTPSPGAPSPSPSPSGGARVDGVSPDSGRPTEIVYLYGQGFAGVRTVSFGGVQARYAEALSSDLIVTMVPAGARTGPVAVITANGSAVGPTFSVTGGGSPTPAPPEPNPNPSPGGPLDPPWVSTLSPGQGGPGGYVYVHGQNLIGVDLVTFGGVPAVYAQSLNPNTILAMVPPGARTGPVIVHTLAGAAVGPTFIVS